MFDWTPTQSESTIRFASWKLSHQSVRYNKKIKLFRKQEVLDELATKLYYTALEDAKEEIAPLEVKRIPELQMIQNQGMLPDSKFRLEFTILIQLYRFHKL